MGWEYTDFEREKLYEEVWAEPVTTVAKRYSMSDVGLRKICKNLEIPLPPAGYWAKLAAGRAVKRSPLGTTKGATTYRRSRYVVPPDNEFDARYIERLESDMLQRPPIATVTPKTSLEDCMPLAKRVAKILEGKGRDGGGWQDCEGPGLMSVTASKINRLRAVLLFNLLLESLDAAGYGVFTNSKDGGPASVSILNLDVSFKVRERSKREIVSLTPEQRDVNAKKGYDFFREDYRYHPTNEFDISAVEPRGTYELAKIGDSRTTRVEAKVADFVNRLRELAIRRQVQAELNAERRVLAEARAEEERRRAEVRQVALERLKGVEELATRLDRANRLRSLAKIFESNCLSSKDGVVDAAWIRRAADWLDPGVAGRWDEVDGPPTGE
ncbi:hypothetical protein [Cupriavidus basilensis]|uniref:hypothetical protein n=1 Tax=Cupriavidus basilensis TaxID=68895 RepID=UPI0020A6BC3D|nr:hypothetical protein [Cupriavidus basilensis]MCP3025093.1 hypothetical protein [Cupriavidus basilensis]